MMIFQWRIIVVGVNCFKGNIALPRTKLHCFALTYTYLQGNASMFNFFVTAINELQTPVSQSALRVRKKSGRCPQKIF
jgi:hypothetical protein